jgi:hypothetical protein
MALERSLGPVVQNTKDPLLRINSMAKECIFMLMAAPEEESGPMTSAYNGWSEQKIQ